MSKMTWLAGMEIWTENTADITFFCLFNEILSQVRGKQVYKFNPRCFVCDEAGTNYNAIRHIYGEEYCNVNVHGCQFHFKSDARKINNVGIEMRDEFIDICKKLCLVTTVVEYLQLKNQMDDMARIYPLKKWIKWWHDCQSHIFLPYHGTGIPMVNLSEQGNKLIKPCHTMQLSRSMTYL